MKHSITILIFFVSSFVFAQQKIETVTLTNGRSIIIYDDYTWSYDVNTNVTPVNQYVPGTINKSSKKSKRSSYSRNSYKESYSSGYCGAKNKTGGYCKRKVKGGGYCWQHR